MSGFFQSFLELQPSAWLILFGMLLILLGLLCRIPSPITESQLARLARFSPCSSERSRSPQEPGCFRGTYAPSHPNRELTPPALQALKDARRSNLGFALKIFIPIPGDCNGRRLANSPAVLGLHGPYTLQSVFHEPLLHRSDLPPISTDRVNAHFV